MTQAETLLADLAQRGIKPTVYVRRGKRTVVWRPYDKLTEADLAALRELWQEVEALVLAGNAAPAPVVAPTQAEPEPVMWTADYSRRITWDDVIAADATKLPKPYERARAFVAKQQQDKRNAELGPLVMRHYTGR